jgi:hypothetical protein
MRRPDAARFDLPYEFDPDTANLANRGDPAIERSAQLIDGTGSNHSW